jgi:hypothetical protein
MQATKIFANLRVSDIAAAKGFYTHYLGLTNEEFNMGWVARYSSADAGARRKCHQHRQPSRLKFDVLDMCGRGYYAIYDHVRETQIHETAGYRWSCCGSDCRDARGRG